MKKIIRENIIKNVVLIVILVTSYPLIQNSLVSSNVSSDTDLIGNLLVAVSILSVIACFGNFAFTYEKVEVSSVGSRFLAHLTTGLLMLLIGLSLEMTSVLAGFLVNTFTVFNFSLVMLYVASVLYDFWDLLRTRLKFL